MFFSSVPAGWGLNEHREAVAGLMRFFSGGVTYSELNSMPLMELFKLIQSAQKQAADETRAIERARNGQ